MNRRFHPIRRKLLGIILLTTLVALLASLAAIVVYDLRAYHQNLIADMSTQSELLGHMTAPALTFDDKRLASENLGMLRARPKVRAAAIYNARGALFATYNADAAAKAVFPRHAESDTVRVDGGELMVFKRIVNDNTVLGTVYLRADYELLSRARDYGGIALAVTAGAMLVAFLMMARLAPLVTHPILAIAGIAREVVAQRDYSRRAEKLSNDEVGTLVDSFNNMLSEIEQRTKALEASNQEIAREAQQRSLAQQEVMRLNAELEGRVRQRTAELEASNAELSKNNRELDAFAYVASHDLKSPLRGIDQLATWITEDLASTLDPDTATHLRLMRSRINRMEMLLSDLLAYSRAGRLDQELSRVDTRALVNDAFDLLSAKHTMTLAVADKLPTLVTLHTPLELVFRNLINNAIKHHHSGKGCIRIRAEAARPGWAFTVSDDGPGIAPEHHDRVFGMFQTLRPRDEVEGSGMGLAIVKKTVESVGGTIALRSDGRSGTAVRFTWPDEATMRKYVDERRKQAV